ncbi:DsbA family protein [Cellulomonas shaoxiangyii]|uniref:Disulfide bond formation protein DsbA n=1 Tax=Cellulomonas shaoxiangyii TaxID=2566013 RepID=A0A4P7SHE9_9CELL|nr:thioredoxin domain-containing protein [Cellulomonas shaoxiangyii]QCB93098.1 disulfide bond formation protein DsbA [Cellulomonas shaoxiangyii]TGY84872.1 disulfide bond formation protein DsbA [Cellulomonas shaoxiangyii]
MTTSAPSAGDAERFVLGDPAAPVTVVEFGDLECPYCRAAAPVLRRFVEESDGRVRLVWRHFPLFEVHPHALAAALAAEAAGARGRFWELHDRLLADQDHLTDDDLRAHASALGLDPEDLVGERAERYADAVRADYADGLALEVTGTPTVFVDGVRLRGRITLEALRAAVDAV